MIQNEKITNHNYYFMSDNNKSLWGGEQLSSPESKNQTVSVIRSLDNGKTQYEFKLQPPTNFSNQQIDQILKYNESKKAHEEQSNKVRVLGNKLIELNSNLVMILSELNAQYPKKVKNYLISSSDDINNISNILPSSLGLFNKSGNQKLNEAKQLINQIISNQSLIYLAERSNDYLEPFQVDTVFEQLSDQLEEAKSNHKNLKSHVKSLQDYINSTLENEIIIKEEAVNFSFSDNPNGENSPRIGLVFDYNS
jgi:hypothetical protein